MGDAAAGVMCGVKLIDEDVGVGVDDAKEIVDGVGNGINLGSGKPIEIFRDVGIKHGRTLSGILAVSVAVGVDCGENSGLQGRGIDIIKEKRDSSASDAGRGMKLRIGDREKGDHGDRADASVELPGGQKLLSRGMTKIEQEGLPALAVETA